MRWPARPEDDDIELREALDRAENAVQGILGLGYPVEWLRPLSNSDPPRPVKVSSIIQIAVEAALS